MLNIAIVLVSFVLALAGLIQSFAAERSDARSILGLTPIGITLIVLSLVGLTLSLAKAFQDEKQSSYRDQMLKEVHAQVLAVQAGTSDPVTAQQLGRIVERMRDEASQGCQSNFKTSDFSESVFSYGNFARASFQGATFENTYFGQARFPDAVFRGADFARADLRGADLSGAVVDRDTKLPTQLQATAFNPAAPADRNASLPAAEQQAR